MCDEETYKRILSNRISELTDSHDLMHDEFLRIKAITNQPSKTVLLEEIEGLCDRAISNINRRVPMIKENEGYRQTIESQKQTHDALINKLTQAQVGIKVLREALERVPAMVSASINDNYGRREFVCGQDARRIQDMCWEALKRTEGIDE